MNGGYCPSRKEGKEFMNGRKGRQLACLVLLLAVLLASFGVVAEANVPAASRLDALGIADGETVRAIVVLKGDAGVDTGLDPQSEQAQEKERDLLVKQERFLAKTDKQDDVICRYTQLLNGVALYATLSELKQMERMPAVEAVYLSNTYVLQDTSEVFPMSLDASEATGAVELDNLFGANGDGIVVAVLDTGVNWAHEALQPNRLMRSPKLSRADVNAVQTTGGGVWLNEKIPFSHDYFDKDDDCDDPVGHGSHVAGLIGGYAEDAQGNVKFRGAAPAVQILGMKVFDASQKTSMDICFAAMEDAYRLGADVVNMSLGGSAAGFTYDANAESGLFGNLYEKLNQAGIAVFCAAGNAGNVTTGGISTAGKQYGYLQGSFADYGMVSNPSTYTPNLSVAAAVNRTVRADGVKFGASGPYYITDTYEKETGSELNFRKRFENQTVSLVCVPGYGREADYAGLNMNGKIAVIKRGEITFQDKLSIAAKQGAIGCILLNQTYELVGMQLENSSIPSAMLTFADIPSMNAAFDAMNGKSVRVTYQDTVFPNPNASGMLNFSSWGPTGDLQFKPEITGVGGQVYSCTAGGSDRYTVMSGTSMACPNVAGSFASLLSYLRARQPKASKQDLFILAKRLLLSTANPLTTGNTYYSPRQQGVGLANVSAAAVSPAYLTNAAQSLGHDPKMSGTLRVTYHVVSRSDRAKTYTVKPSVLMDTPKTLASDGLSNVYNTTEPMSLDGEMTYTVSVNGKTGNSFTLQAFGEADVTVTMQLSAQAKQRLASFPNGGFTDGFVFFTEQGSAEAAFHGSFIAFYGDWLQASSLETYDTLELVECLSELQSNGKLDAYFAQGYELWDILTRELEDFQVGWNEAYLQQTSQNRIVWLGRNAYDGNYPATVNAQRNAFSVPSLTDGAGCFADSVLFIPCIVRNCKQVNVTVADAQNGTVYSRDELSFVTKGAYVEKLKKFVQQYNFRWDGTDRNGQFVPSGTHAVVTVETVLDYPGAQPRVEWQFPITVDYVCPRVQYSYDASRRQLKIDATDSEFLAALRIRTVSGTEVFSEMIEPDTRGTSYSKTVDLSSCGEDKVTVEVIDWATNVRRIELPLNEGDRKSGVPGDLNGNGVVDANDCLRARRAYFGLTNLTAEELQAVDFNGNGSLEASECLRQRRIFFGLV